MFIRTFLVGRGQTPSSYLLPTDSHVISEYFLTKYSSHCFVYCSRLFSPARAGHVSYISLHTLPAAEVPASFLSTKHNGFDDEHSAFLSGSVHLELFFPQSALPRGKGIAVESSVESIAFTISSISIPSPVQKASFDKAGQRSLFFTLSHSSLSLARRSTS